MDDNRLAKLMFDEIIKLKKRPTRCMQTLNDLKEANTDMAGRYFAIKFIRKKTVPLHRNSEKADIRRMK